jgi:hypothetical protein
LTDLLRHAGHLELPEMTEVSYDLREYFLLGYAEMLLSHPSLWQVGLKYLSYCPIYGATLLEHYLLHIPFNNEHMLRKLLQAARDYSCPNAFKLLNQVAAQYALKKKLYGSAIIHLMDAEVFHLVSPVCDQILEHYASTG